MGHTKIETLQEIAFALDTETGNMGVRVTSILDMRESLAQLRIEADNITPEHIRFHWSEFSRKIRLLDDLMTYKAKDLEEDFQNIQCLKESLFDEVVREQKSPSSSKTKGA